MKSCKTCRNFGSHAGHCDICHEFNCWTEKEDKQMNIREQYLDAMCSVEQRKKLAKKYNLDAQEIIDLPRDKYEIFISGLEIGEKYGASKIIEYLKSEYEKEKEVNNDNEK